MLTFDILKPNAPAHPTVGRLRAGRAAICCLGAVLAAACSPGKVTDGAAVGDGPDLPIAVDDFVSLAESSWGTSATGRDNLLRRVPPNHAFDTLPFDTSGWATDTSLQTMPCSADASTLEAILARELAAAPDTRLILPDCDIKILVSDGTSRLIGRRDRIELVGQAHTRFVMEEIAPLFDWQSTDYTARAPRIDAFRVSTTPADTALPAIAACDWIGGYAMGTRKLLLDPACALAATGDNAWGVGDLVYIETDAFPGAGPANPIHRMAYRLTCVDGAVLGLADRVGSEAGCAELDGDHQVQIDRPLLMDYGNGAYYMGGASVTTKPTGHVVRQMERVGAGRGGAGVETHNIAEYVGFRNIRWYRPNGYLYNSGSGALRFARIADAWVVGNDFQTWGNAWLTFQADASRVLMQNNRYTAPVNRAICVGELVSLGSNPAGDVRLTLYMDTSVTDCDVQADQFDGRVYLGRDIAEPSLRNKIRTKVFVSETPSTVVIDLPGVPAAGLVTTGGGLVSVLNNWNVASAYVNGPANTIHFVGEYYDGSRMGPLLQSGAAGVAMVYAWMEHDANEHCSRGLFFHGNSSAPGALVEGNRLDCPIVPYASSNRTDDGEGINVTYFKNRLVRSGPETYPDGLANFGGGGLTRGTFDVAEHTDQAGAANENFTWLSNVFYEFYQSTSAIDDVANDGDGGAAVAPYHLYMPTLLRNRCYAAGCNLDDNLDTQPQANPTTYAPDIVDGELGESPTVPAAWHSDVVPTSLYYRADQLVRGVPAWWCREAAPFGQIGAHYDDFTTAETITAARLIGTDQPCTPP